MIQSRDDRVMESALVTKMPHYRSITFYALQAGSYGVMVLFG